MTGVWAYAAGEWSHRGANGFTHVIRIRGLEDLVAELRWRASRWGAIERLGIVAHGDADGVVRLQPTVLNPHTARTRLASELDKLSRHLAPDAVVTFYACVAGAGLQGTALLVAVSERLPGRTVVGFEVMGEIAASGLPNTAGRVRERQHASGEGRHAWLTPHSVFAKWARNGVREAPTGGTGPTGAARRTAPGMRRASTIADPR